MEPLSEKLGDALLGQLKRNQRRQQAWKHFKRAMLFIFIGYLFFYVVFLLFCQVMIACHSEGFFSLNQITVFIGMDRFLRRAGIATGGLIYVITTALRGYGDYRLNDLKKEALFLDDLINRHCH